MKFFFLLLLIPAPLHADLLATFHTTQGNVVVALHHEKTPQTVANFITLAEGTRSRIDPFTGAVIRKPLYAGEKFYRIVNDSGFRIAQTGSGTGTNSGGPGYTFRDEFDPSLTHVPYVIAMANAGSAHGNGSQIYLTGADAIPSLDFKHTVFGIINDPASRAVIDLIMAAGDNATTINSVSFNRTDAPAQAFDEHAWELPACSGLNGALKVVPSVSVAYELAAPQPGGSLLHVRRSLNLQSWEGEGTLYQAAGASGYGSITIDNGSLGRAFYNIALVTYPDALAPAGALLANRTLVMEVDGSTMTFMFGGDGLGGTFIFSGDPEPGSFTLYSYTPQPHSAQWIMNTSLLGGLKFDCNLDSETPSEILGRNTAYQYQVPGFVEVGSGGLTLSK